MGNSRQSAAANTIAENLREQAEEHKRLERRHRALAQRNFATLRELESLLASIGIPVERVVPKERGK